MSSLLRSSALLDERHPAVRRDLADIQGLHRTVMSLFPDLRGDARRACGVLFGLERGPFGPELTVQSSCAPAWGRLERLEVQDGLPVAAEECRGKVRFDRKEVGRHETGG